MISHQELVDRAVLEEAQDLFTAGGGVAWDDLSDEERAPWLERGRAKVSGELVKLKLFGVC